MEEKKKNDYEHMALINEILNSENEELKKINKGLLDAYNELKKENETLKKEKENLNNYYDKASKYEKYFPYIDRFRKYFVKSEVKNE